MRKILFVMLLFSLNRNLKAQTVNYLDIRDTIVTFSCGAIDIDIVYKTKEKLLNLDTTLISDNIYLYYKDIASCYYRIWANTKYVNDAYTAIKYNKLAISKNPNDPIAYWDISLIYYFLGECDNGDYYLQLYKEKTKESEWDLDEIKLLKKICKNKN